MKKRFFLIGITCTLMLEIIVLIIFSTRTPDLSQDIVAVNEVIQSVTQDFDHLENHQNETNLQYVVLDHNEQILYKTSTGLSENIHSAICNRDTILDIEKNGKILGKVIIFNQAVQDFQSQKRSLINTVVILLIIQVVVCFIYQFVMFKRMIQPFQKLRGFAERIAGGNLDIPLEMDRHNLFGGIYRKL